MSDKIRADVFLTTNGLCPSREKAQAAIMAGLVYLGEKKINKASEMISAEASLTLRAPAKTYVSRGALKLEKALRVFDADLRDRVVMDIGASTGGFTEICLLNGARKVYAIDVGYGQLDWKLRNDPRVCVMERTNARYLTPQHFDPLPSVTVMDVSFISIRLILPVAAAIMGSEGIFYTLIKPQFEAGRGKVGKKGVVRDPLIHEEVLNETVSFAEGMRWHIDQLDFSPITGPEGNIEFLAKIVPVSEGMNPLTSQEIRSVVLEAHKCMNT